LKEHQNFGPSNTEFHRMKKTHNS